MVKIIGAGMAGLLAGLMFRKDGHICEAAKELPNNHHALLRFRTNAIGQYLNMPFKEVKVMKVSKKWRNEIADTISYSHKCTGLVDFRSSTTAKAEVEKRYIAPSDFISQLARHQANEVDYSVKVDRQFIETHNDKPIISTMPMPTLMNILGYESNIEFKSVGGIVIKFDIGLDTDFCSTIYYPDPIFLPYRASMTGRDLIIEMAVKDSSNADLLVNQMNNDIDFVIDDILRPVLIDFGLESIVKLPSNILEYEVHRQRYAKILPADERERKKFIMWATDKFNVYSLGRFAVWRPGLLLDDVFEDIQVIQNMLKESNYERRK